MQQKIPVQFYNRYTQQVENEAVWVEALLQWGYGTRLGRMMTFILACRPWLSAWYGWRMKRPASRQKIKPFIDAYAIDTTEFAKPVETFRTFNDFFCRRLKPEARAINPDPGVIVFPADGRHFGVPDSSRIDSFFLKGQQLSLIDLVQSDELAARYRGGALVLSRLCPVDYHRFHFPIAGQPMANRLINGLLFSVNPIALARNLSYLWQNRRWLSEIQTESAGRLLMIEVGATAVGSVKYSFEPGQPVTKGQEKGYFEFGGSAVLTLFEPGRVTLAEDLCQHSNQQREIYAHMGDILGFIN